MSSLKTTIVSLLAATAQLAAALPKPRLHARILGNRADVKDEYDYVIVGGGTAGLTVGDRLTENGKYSVLVIEYGIYHEQTGMNPARMFNITSTPSPSLNNRQFSVGLGCGVGGSSIVNGQIMLRGTKEEYDAWKELGGPDSDWDWENLLPYFKKAATFDPPDEQVAKEFNISYNTDYWGSETPLYAAFGKGRPANITKKLHGAMSGMPGVSVAEDSGAGQNGVYWYTTSHDPKTSNRSYARTAHWDNVRRDNYEMIIESKVNQILLGDDMTAMGVEFVSTKNGSVAQKVMAKREVIVAAGAIHTPQVLMLSGIGPRDNLESAGIAVKVELPGVGANFQDHSYIPFIGYFWGNPPPNEGPGGPMPMYSAPNLVAMIGMPALAPESYEDLASRYEKQDPKSHLPEFYTPEQVEGYSQQQAVYARMMRSLDSTFNEMMLMGPGGSIQNMHPLSRGTVRLNPKEPKGEVIVDYRGATNAMDLEIMANNVDFVRRYMASGVFAEYKPFEIFPGANYTTTEQLMEWSRSQIIPSVYHPIGTCAKVPKEHGGCVDEKLKVYGTQKLSVIDASVMPTTVGATTQLSVYAVAEKAADIIMARTFD